MEGGEWSETKRPLPMKDLKTRLVSVGFTIQALYEYRYRNRYRCIYIYIDIKVKIRLDR